MTTTATLDTFEEGLKLQLVRLEQAVQDAKASALEASSAFGQAIGSETDAEDKAEAALLEVNPEASAMERMDARLEALLALRNDRDAASAERDRTSGNYRRAVAELDHHNQLMEALS